MKRVFASLLLLVGLSTQAATVVIDGVPVPDASVVIITSGPITPDPVEPTPDPDPVLPTPTPTPTPSPTGRCENTNTILCAYDVRLSEWLSPQRVEVRIDIPSNKTVVSTFRTRDVTTEESVKFSYWTAPGWTPAFVNAWVSQDVNSTLTDVPRACRVTNQAGTYNIKASTQANRYECALKPGQTYFLHIQHAAPTGMDSKINREMTTWN